MKVSFFLTEKQEGIRHVSKIWDSISPSPTLSNRIRSVALPKHVSLEPGSKQSTDFYPFEEKGNDKMELEKIINDTQELSQRFHEVVGPWDRSLLVTHLAAVVGRLADDVMIIEGKLAMPLENARLARNIADALMQLIRLSNSYQIDLEQAWVKLLEEAHAGMDNEALVTMMRETIRQNQTGDTYHGK